MPTTASCPKCSTPLPEGGRFCTGCGLDISDPSGSTTISFTKQRVDELQRMVAEATKGVYTIERQLGRGGMAAVYLGTELELNRKVAIKILPPEFTFGEGLVERFQREARTAAQLDHPHIIPIYRVGQAGRLLYFAMKYVEGRSLADIVRERKALPIPTVTAVLEAVGSALAYAHGRGVVHRDIKPANILIDKQGVVLVSDFGIARAASDDTITQSGAVVGTPQYMSPEQCAGRRVTPASDQYSLGVVGFEMLSGRPPFDADSAITLLQMHITVPPPRLAPLRPDAQQDLIRAIERTIRKRPEERFPSMAEFTEAVELIRIAQQHAPEGRAQLKALAAGDTLSGLKVVTPISGPSKVRRPRRTALIVGTVVAAVVAGTAGIGIWRSMIAPRSAPPPVERRTLDSAVGPVLATGSDSAPQRPAQAAAAPQDTTRRPPVQPGRAQQLPAAPAAAPPPRATTATLAFQGAPSGAQITVDGNPTTGGRATVAPGSHTIEVRADGYQPLTQSVSVNAGDTRTVRLTLQPVAADPGSLSVGSFPAGTLFIDGQRVGDLASPLRNHTLPSGRRRIRIEAEGYEPFDSVITVGAGQSVNLRMIRLRPRG